MELTQTLQQEFKLPNNIAENIIRLIDEGNTIPFIARYRKEQTGSMDDQTLREFFDRLTYLRNLEKRKEEITASITEQGNMTDEIAASIQKAATLAALDDIYRPFRPKRRTRASIAAEKGLKPLADAIKAAHADFDPQTASAAYLNEEKGVSSIEDALQGAMDILAEEISDSANIRTTLRRYLAETAQIVTKEAAADPVYRMYADYSEPVRKIANHRILAIDRGEKIGALKVSIEADTAGAYALIEKQLLPKQMNACTELLKATIADSYNRLLFPSLERELRGALTERACTDSIKIFAQNLKQLLMQPPLKDKIVLALDPGYAHGCKCAAVDTHGNVLTTGIIYPTQKNRIPDAKRWVLQVINRYHVSAIAIGNGTASRETERFTADLLRENNLHVGYMIVSEAGASVYSASKLAAAEFPDFDVSLRSAVSIARRMQDPLAELIKIDPKAIGVGQYQHDMPPKQMDEALGGVVEDCVNTVGVDLNTASETLLTYVAGIGPAVAKNIVAFRSENGGFKNRKQLLKVSKLGPKAFTQCAGFLRVSGSDNVLDNTGVHPESYEAAGKLLSLCRYTPADIGNLPELEQRVSELGIRKVSESIGVGEPTVRDIMTELLKPGRDPRDELPKPLLRDDVLDIKDLKVGMELKGTVRNLTDFGAFIDIGVHEAGLVHISRICNRFIKHPSEVLKVGEVVTVWVHEIDLDRGRIALTMKEPK